MAHDVCVRMEIDLICLNTTHMLPSHHKTMDEKACIIEWDRLDMMADGYTPDFVNICREFIKEIPLLFSTLEHVLQENDVEKARRVAHQIKGSAANFGFVGVSIPMADLESSAREGSLEGATAKLQRARECFALAAAEFCEKRGLSL